MAETKLCSKCGKEPVVTYNKWYGKKCTAAATARYFKSLANGPNKKSRFIRGGCLTVLAKAFPKEALTIAIDRNRGEDELAVKLLSKLKGSQVKKAA